MFDYNYIFRFNLNNIVDILNVFIFIKYIGNKLTSLFLTFMSINSNIELPLFEIGTATINEIWLQDLV